MFSNGIFEVVHLENGNVVGTEFSTIGRLGLKRDIYSQSDNSKQKRVLVSQYPFGVLKIE